MDSARMTVLPTTVVVTRQRFLSGKSVAPEEIEEYTLAIHKFATEPAVVGVERGLTINLGDYNSTKVSISLYMPCYAEEVEDTFALVEKWVEDKTLKVANEARKFAGSRNSDPF